MCSEKCQMYHLDIKTVKDSLTSFFHIAQVHEKCVDTGANRIVTMLMQAINVEVEGWKMSACPFMSFLPLFHTKPRQYNRDGICTWRMEGKTKGGDGFFTKRRHEFRDTRKRQSLLLSNFVLQDLHVLAVLDGHLVRNERLCEGRILEFSERETLRKSDIVKFASEKPPRYRWFSSKLERLSVLSNNLPGTSFRASWGAVFGENIHQEKHTLKTLQMECLHVLVGSMQACMPCSAGAWTAIEQHLPHASFRVCFSCFPAQLKVVAFIVLTERKSEEHETQSIQN